MSALFGIVALRGVAIWLMVYASGHAVAALVQRSDDVWSWLVLTGIGIGLEPLAEAWQGAAAVALQRRFSTQQALLVAEAANAPHGIAHLENADNRARFSDIEAYLRSMYGVNAMYSVWMVIGYSAVGLGGLVAAAQWSWPVALWTLLDGHPGSGRGGHRHTGTDADGGPRCAGRHQRPGHPGPLLRERDPRASSAPRPLGNLTSVE